MTGENAKTRLDATPAVQQIASRRPPPPAGRPSASSRDLRMSALVRVTSIAVRPQATAPKKPDITAIAHAGLGCPRKVTNPSARENTQAHIVQSG